MRKPGWEDKLLWLMASITERPYKLGEHDCFTVANAVVETLTGAQPPQQFSYSTEEQAVALIMERGGFEQAFSWYFGVLATDVNYAQRGDICCYIDGVGKKHLGVCMGSWVGVLGPDGLLKVPLRSCLVKWKIG